jgi:adenylate cyclase
VAARTSAFSFKGSRVAIDSIGRALRVRHVLEGSIRNGARWRVTAQLIDARTGYHLWSDKFEASLANVVSLEGAIRRAPYSGYAHASVATVRHWQASSRWAPAESSSALARPSANRALTLDSSLVDGWLILGHSGDVIDRDFSWAESYYARAIEMAPSDSRPYSRRATMLPRLGRNAEALASAEQAVSLDPASPAVCSDLSILYAELNRFADAVWASRRALALDPGHPHLLGNLSLHLAHQRTYRDSDSVIALVRAQLPEDPTLLGQHAFSVANLGQVERARALVDSAAARGLSNVNREATMLAVGDTSATCSLLERALREGDDELPVRAQSGSASSRWSPPPEQHYVSFSEPSVNDLFRFSRTVERDAAIEQWMREHASEPGAIARR